MAKNRTANNGCVSNVTIKMKTISNGEVAIPTSPISIAVSNNERQVI